MTTTITTASKQWHTRPDDERFLTLQDLKSHVGQRRRESWTARPRTTDLRAVVEDDDLRLAVYDPTHGQERLLEPSNWGFNQLAQYAHAPASYLRTLPAPIAAINLQWGLERNPMRDDALVLGQTNGHDALRAMTSTSYGRIWDSQVVDAVERVNIDGRWQVPAASYQDRDPKRATTLYASDRDVFIFLVDPTHPIIVPGEDGPLFRGFMTWNSEVGSAVFGLTTFLYRTVCDNRIVWGATDIKELRIRHTGGAPDRFAYEGARYLRRYSEEATTRAVEGIVAAKNALLPIEDGRKAKDSVMDWLSKRGFTKSEASSSYDAAVAEEGRARTVWDIVQGVTAHARSVAHTDARVDLETRAGKLMAAVAG